MPRTKKIDTEVDATTNSTNPDVQFSKQLLELNLELGRQDLNDNFRKIQDAINQLIK